MYYHKQAVVCIISSRIIGMRIVAGEFKGRRINVPKQAGLRPTTDRVREAVFSTLGSCMDLKEASVLDLFSGTGAFGLEALSRDAAFCFFIEADKLLTKTLCSTIAEFGLQQRAEVLRDDVFRVLTRRPRPGKRSEAYTLVFADPPYAEADAQRLVAALIDNGWVGPKSLLVFENKGGIADFPQTVVAQVPLETVLLKEKKYGATVVSYITFK